MPINETYLIIFVFVGVSGFMTWLIRFTLTKYIDAQKDSFTEVKNELKNLSLKLTRNDAEYKNFEKQMQDVKQTEKNNKEIIANRLNSLASEVADIRSIVSRIESEVERAKADINEIEFTCKANHHKSGL